MIKYLTLILNKGLFMMNVRLGWSSQSSKATMAQYLHMAKLGAVKHIP
jgi:hypothetical protein